jgi:hypothetical protein
VATTERRVGRAITGKRSVRCKRRVNDRSLLRSPSAELPAIGALVRLLARQSAIQWLQAVANEHYDKKGSVSVGPGNRNARGGQDDVE